MNKNQKNRKKWIVAGLALLGLVLWLQRNERPRAPDQKLVGHFGQLCKIADKGAAQPYRGVKKMFGYYGDHGPEMLEQFGELLVLIERIPDDRTHDRRARLAAKRMAKALARCERTYERFFLAVEADPKASQLMERGLSRFGRTLEILFGGGQGAGNEGIDPFGPLRRWMLPANTAPARP